MHEQYSAAKMMAGFWFMVVLVGSQLYLCLGGCSVYDHPSGEEIHRCNSLEKMFEKALVNNEDNLYILRDTFDSNSHPSPNMMMVTYVLLTAQGNVWKLVTIPWTNSRIFTVINPTILFTFQSGLLTVIYYNLIGHRVINTPQITLALPVSKDERNMIIFETTRSEVDYILSTLTKRLQMYAYPQSTPLHQREVRSGFALPPTTSKFTPWNKYTILIGIATLLLVVTAFLFTSKFMTYFSQQTRNHHAAYMKLTYFWSFVQVIFFINICELITQIAVIGFTCANHDPTSPIKVFLMGITILAIAIGTTCGCLQNESNLPPLLLNSKRRYCCCTFLRFKRYFYNFMVCNIYFFVSLICTSTITTGIYALVNPILVLSTVAYVITSIFCCVVIFSLPLSANYLLQKLSVSGNVKEFTANCSYICKSIPFILMFFVVNLLMLLYLIMLYQLDITNTNDIFQAASSFLPSLILGTLGYFTTKFTKRKLRDKFTEPDAIDNDSLKLAEEGEILKGNEDESVHLLLNIEDTEL